MLRLVPLDYVLLQLLFVQLKLLVTEAVLFMVLIVFENLLQVMRVGRSFSDDDVAFFLPDFLFSPGNFNLKDVVDDSAHTWVMSDVEICHAKNGLTAKFRSLIWTVANDFESRRFHQLHFSISFPAFLVLVINVFELVIFPPNILELGVSVAKID